MSRGAAVGLLPVVPLLAYGSGDDGLFLDPEGLGVLAGLKRARIPNALKHLSALGLIAAPSPRDNPVKITVPSGTHLDGEKRGAFFYFPGRLLATGLWADLASEEKCTLLALLALAPSATYEEHDCIPEEVWDWCDEIGASETVDIARERDRRREYKLARRTALADWPWLSAVTGLEVESCQLAFDRLASRESAVIETSEWEDDLSADSWYHLPEVWWDPAARVGSRDQCP